MDTLYLIAFISTVWYGCNILADCTLDNRPIRSHLGYGLVSIITTYYLVQTLCILLSIVVIVYTALMLFCYLDKSKK